MENDNKKRSLRLVGVGISLVIVLAFLIGAAPQIPAAAQTCKYKHTVQPGETITYIADLYSTSWEDIADANNMQPPYTIIVGTVLCIPEGTSPGNVTPVGTGTPTGKKGATLSVVPSLGHIFVSVEGFPKKTSYYVRVFPRKGSWDYPPIGHFTTDKNGSFADWFKLPNSIPWDPNMGVCVKNVWTDAVSCVKYDNPEPWVQEIIFNRCPKEGR
jgi:hypothetical protein